MSNITYVPWSNRHLLLVGRAGHGSLDGFGQPLCLPHRARSRGLIFLVAGAGMAGCQSERHQYLVHSNGHGVSAEMRVFG